ncbi:hypothetical protein PV08_00047 [Exophiala spinifera]|uniref:Monopolin complex subunit Csm1/Pcs1 C-terminal domain-containing protein n=1 Tax=Exophiala spinifera TaxID=91928 RepID=A0A0D2BLN9_9EURO|nr:uncharacterized protein PV08_00047 [Exophiala spinifera]KIW19475.1 hypothetical protein PV08_00047 [Exophiala spinifera]
MKGIAQLLDSDIEETAALADDRSDVSSEGEENATNSTQAKKRRKRQRVTMPAKKIKTSDQPSATTHSKKAPSKRKVPAQRKPIEDELDQPSDGDTQNSDAKQRAPEPKQKKSTGATQTKPKTKKLPRTTEDQLGTRKENAKSEPSAKDSDPKDEVEPPRPSKKTTGARKPSALKENVAPIIESLQETFDESEESELMPAEHRTRPQQVSRNPSRTRQESVYQRRPVSTAGTDNLRRELGDITRQLENSELRYRSLKEVGIDEAMGKMEALRREHNVTVQASNDVIASLKRSLAAQPRLDQEVQRLRTDLQSRVDEISGMQREITALNGSLSAATNEVKALQAKLAATRAPSVETMSSKASGSAVKGKSHGSVAMGNSDAAQAVQYAQMKEDLYSDLTGLIVRSVKKADSGDTFDCIQTGQNGTLHFKLFVPQEGPRGAHFEEPDILYTPLLDGNRDRDMIEIMPSYLTEVITFSRQNAAKFYGRVVDTLTKRRPDD